MQIVLVARRPRKTDSSTGRMTLSRETFDPSLPLKLAKHASWGIISQCTISEQLPLFDWHVVPRKNWP
jgi:hypothetical protein